MGTMMMVANWRLWLRMLKYLGSLMHRSKPQWESGESYSCDMQYPHQYAALVETPGLQFCQRDRRREHCRVKDLPSVQSNNYLRNLSARRIHTALDLLCI